MNKVFDTVKKVAKSVKGLGAKNLTKIGAGTVLVAASAVIIDKLFEKDEVEVINVSSEEVEGTSCEEAEETVASEE